MSTIDIFLWLVALLTASFVGVAPAMFLFRSLPSAGAFLIKPVGILIVGYFAWLCLFTQVFHNGRGYQTTILLLAIVGSVVILKLRPELARAAKRQLRHIAIGEAIFATTFIGFAIFRARNPDIIATEKPMDFAMMNALIRAINFPPADPWLSGFDINYYYFGYSLVATFTTITGTIPEVAFNLALAMTFSLAFLGMFSLGYDLTACLNNVATRTIWGFATLTASLGILGGNLYAINFFVGKHNRDPDFWRGIGWNASRVVQTEGTEGLQDYTINEFPAFSFLLGDLHPHVMALPFSILSIAIAVAWFVTWSQVDKLHHKSWLFAVVSGWLLGSLYVLNAWDFPVFLVFTGLGGFAALYKHHRAEFAWSLILKLGVATTVGIIVFLPFHLTFDPFVSGFGFVSIRTEIDDFLVVYGLWALGALSMAVIYLSRGENSDRWLLIIGSVWLIVVWMINANISVLLLCLLILLSTVVTFRRMDENYGGGVLQFLYFGGFGLAAVPEILFLRDFFGPPYERMNTVFKIYYQAWPILAAASGTTIYIVFRQLSKLSNVRRLISELLFSGLLTALIFVVMSYTAITGKARTEHEKPSTLNGLDFAKRQYPDEVLAIQWLRSNTDRDAIIVEATGSAYTDFGRISAWTGIPTIIGWDQHEQLWREHRTEIDKRIAEVDSLYQGLSQNAALSILRKYGVSHVYVGRLERQKYGPHVDDIFTWMSVIFEVPDSVTVYKVPGP